VNRTIFEEEHEMFRASFAVFLERSALPFWEAWEQEGRIDRSLYEEAGRGGFLGMAAPEEFGGGGREDFRFNAVILEECQRLGLASVGASFALHNDVCLPYFTSLTTHTQRERWLPGLCAGTSIAAIAMTEPGAGSDLAGVTTSAVLDGDHYVVNGSKTFITSGINADLVVVVVRTDTTSRHGGLRGTPLPDRGAPTAHSGLVRGRLGERRACSQQLGGTRAAGSDPRRRGAMG
jgi:long-chain-acyl-CoA dehydrogenase